MSKLFLALGVLVVAALFTALIGPFLVDWTSYRQHFEREASAYIGRPVAIAGKADLRLLPTPVLSFADVRIGDPGAPDLEMERFRAEVELAPLLKGEVRIIQMTVERPRMHLDLAGLEGGAAGPGWRLDPEQISLANLEVIDGTAVIADSRLGRSWQATDIDAMVEAGSLRGPARIEAKLGLDGAPLRLQAALGRAGADGSVTANVSVSSPLHPLTLAADGVLSWAADATPVYAGNATILGPPPPEESEAPSSHWSEFRGVGAFEVTPLALSIAEAQVSYGGTELPLVLEGSGRLDLGAEPRFDITVKARQIDIDRVLGGGAERPVSIDAALAALVAALTRLPDAPLPGQFHFDAQGVVLGGSVVQSVGIDLATAPEGWRIDGLAATFPGDTRLALEGMLTVSDAPSFQGRGSVASGSPAALAAWWRGQAGSAALIKGFSVEADIELGPGAQRFSKIAATTGGGGVAGSVELRRFEGTGQLFAAVDLAADRADLVETRALAELLAGDWLSSDSVDQMTLSLRADVLSAAGIDARSVEVAGAFEAGQLQLSNLSVGDLAGAGITARGSIDDPFGTPTGRLDASINAEDLTGAAAFLAGLLPENRLVGHLSDAAPILSPVRADVTIAAGGSENPLALDVTGRFAGTNLTLSATGQGSLREPDSLSGTVNLHVDGEDSGAVLAQLGLQTLPVRAGPLRVDAQFSGGARSAGTLQVNGTVAGVELTYAAETSVKDGELAAAGAVEAESADIDPALLLAGLAVPGIGEGHAALAAGRLQLDRDGFSLALERGAFNGQPVGGSMAGAFSEGVSLSGTLDLETLSLPLLAGFAAGATPGVAGEGWSDTPFAPALPPSLALDLNLTSKTLGLGLDRDASDAKLGLELSGGALNIDLVDSRFADGRLKGAVAASIGDGGAQATIRGTLAGGQLQALVWEGNALPVASGLVDGSFDVSGAGRSMAALVSTLAGSGSFAVNDGRFNALNPQAITAVVDIAADGEAPSLAEARERFASLFGAGALPFGRAAGAFSVAAGVVDMATVSIAAGATALLADATLDLNDFSLASEWTIREAEPGVAADAQPFVRVRFSGPMADPVRQIDLNPLIDLLRSRILQRQLDELERLEAQRRRMDARLRQLQETAPPRRPDPGISPPGFPPLDVTASDRPAAAAPQPAASPGAGSSTGAPGVEPSVDVSLGEVPLDLLALPEAPSAGSASDASAPPRREEAARGATAEPPAATAAEDVYRTLPNGVVIKVR